MPGARRWFHMVLEIEPHHDRRSVRAQQIDRTLSGATCALPAEERDAGHERRPVCAALRARLVQAHSVAERHEVSRRDVERGADVSLAVPGGISLSVTEREDDATGIAFEPERHDEVR